MKKWVGVILSIWVLFGMVGIVSATNTTTTQDNTTLIANDTIETNSTVISQTNETITTNTNVNDTAPTNVSNTKPDYIYNNDTQTPSNNVQTTTTTNTDTTTKPIINIHTPKDTITKDEEGVIEISATNPFSAGRKLIVEVYLTIPSGMIVSGGENVISGGGGVYTTQFIVEPGETKTLYIRLSSNEEGTYNVHGYVRYKFENEQNYKEIMYDHRFEVTNKKSSLPINTTTILIGGLIIIGVVLAIRH